MESSPARERIVAQQYYSGDQACSNMLQKLSQPSALRITCKQHWQLFRDKLLVWMVKWATSATSNNDARIWYPYKCGNLFFLSGYNQLYAPLGKSPSVDMPPTKTS